MVNGRLPFNDAQLVEMEEEMRMQRLRFERNISFGKISSHHRVLMEWSLSTKWQKLFKSLLFSTECMTLIRKLLQFSPQNRPTIGEVLRDCWLTGKKPIPRQLNRPKVEVGNTTAGELWFDHHNVILYTWLVFVIIVFYDHSLQWILPRKKRNKVLLSRIAWARNPNRRVTNHPHTDKQPSREPLLWTKRPERQSS